MNRLSLAALLLLVPAAAAPAQTYEDPYKVIIAPRNYWYGSPVADVIRAQGQFLIDVQQVNLMQQQVKREKLVTRRKELEHWAWERKFIPLAFEEQKELSHRIEVRRIVKDARPAEIYSGAALNALRDELLRPEAQSAGAVSTPVQAEWLDHIHVTGVVGNAGLLKANKIAWPLMIAGRPELAADRLAIEGDLADAKAAVLRGETADPMLLIALRNKVDGLQARLASEVRGGGDERDWSPGQYVAARRSLNELKESLPILERPDAAYYLNPLKGNTVAEVMDHMKSNGVKFAAATIGDERFYTALYYAMREELARVGGVPQEPANP